MKCNQEQFEVIKPKLKGMRIGCISNFNEWNYLVNNEDGDPFVICNRGESGSKRYNREVHETWNERIFLEACGIETFEITKETILKYKMKDEFPEVFEVKLKNNTWHVCHHYSSRHLVNLNLTDKSATHDKGFGFDSHGKWTNDLTFLKTFDYRFEEANEQEVFEALKNEAVRRRFGQIGIYFNSLDNDKCISDIEGFDFWNLEERDSDENKYNIAVCKYGGVIFRQGIWAEIIPTLTKKEAEEKLNCKIV